MSKKISIRGADIPGGYANVTDGVIQPGDLLWNDISRWNEADEGSIGNQVIDYKYVVRRVLDSAQRIAELETTLSSARADAEAAKAERDLMKDARNGANLARATQRIKIQTLEDENSALATRAQALWDENSRLQSQLATIGDAIKPAFLTCESCGPEKRFHVVARFQSLEQAQQFHGMLIGIRDGVQVPDVESAIGCQMCGDASGWIEGSGMWVCCSECNDDGTKPKPPRHAPPREATK